MNQEEALLHTLTKGLHAEFEAIKFYLENLANLNYTKNKTAIDKLTLDSIEHAKDLVSALLKRQEHLGGELNKEIVQQAQLEEFSMREIYSFELKRAEKPEIKQIFKHLIAEEETHERLVDCLK